MTANSLATHIGQIALVCRDVPKQMAFYRDVVRLPFLFETSGLAFFQCGATRLMLSVKDGEGVSDGNSILYFFTDDLNGAVAVLKNASAKVPQEPHLIARLADREVWMCHWHDAEDNIMAFMQEKPLS
jgi:methylmalonyl-CoA/ethylmalonyl-CoA epimerase